ncbi:hypothetical protein TIFTF001_010518 [Ficus carica]|uniref:non-specific serine/threonine protein kinase n=1 Tax=Ficus carica TaxID=3494 RepID=A0AA87ZQ85_FICCA|nr:hypothetical protein TIFTF001_010518 [Ficus carica]
MTKLPLPSVVAAVIVIVLSSVISSTNALGSGATLAVTHSGAVCGVAASLPFQRIVCHRRSQNVDVYGNVSFSSISGGGTSLCGLRTGGYALLCWDLSLENSTAVTDDKRVYFDATVALENLAVGYDHTCATVVGNGTVKCWRYNKNAFRFPSGSDRFASISSGSGFSCGILKDNSRAVRCWGSGTLPTKIENDFGNMSMASIFAGNSHVCGVNVTGFLVCKGTNDSGQLNAPVGSEAFEYSQLSLGANHSCAIRASNGTVVCWGGEGRFSVNETNGVSFELIVSSLDFTCGLTTVNFSVVCWGPGSRIMGRQRSGTSSKHADRAEEFTFPELAMATKNFSLENKLGAGSFGVVYRGKLADGREVAIKRSEMGQMTRKYQEKESAFESELAFLSRLHHKHLVKLVGFCEEKEERLLVYEYMKNGALYDHLHDKNNVEKQSSVLNSWKIRIKIALDAARGIEYLHNYAVPPIIHRDIKSSNILLDANWTAKVSDFGLSLMGPESGRDFRPTKAAGTVGYIDPEYYGLNVLTAKSDVYGLGVVLLELLTGKRAIFKNGEDGGMPISVVDFAVPAIMAGELAKVLDQRAGLPELNEGEAVELVAYTAMHCVNLEGKERPTMIDIVANLERALSLCDDSHGSISSGIISIASE